MNVLIAGRVRDEAEFIKSIECAIQVVKATEGGRVVISSWRSCQQVIEKALVNHNDGEIEVRAVYSRDFSYPVLQNSLRQGIQWHAGLTQFEQDEYVLKMRTDKTNWVKAWSANISKYTEVPKPLDPTFKGRIIIPTGFLHEPFFCNDMVFSGYTRDLLKLIPETLQPIIHCWKINAEQFFHSSPLLGTSSWTIISNFFLKQKGLPGHLESDALRNRNAEIFSDLISLKTILLYLRHLEDSYFFYNDFSELSPEEEQALAQYFEVAADDLVSAMSAPPPIHLNRLISYSPKAKTIIVKSMSAVSAFRCICEKLYQEI
jgi:hypothetical protein